MKVSRKVGRRSRKHASSVSVSRRRLRNKKSKSGYRKKHAKTQRGGKRGKCTRTRSRGYRRTRTHKRGKRFHRGGRVIPLIKQEGCYLYYKTTSDQIPNWTTNFFIPELILNDDDTYTLKLRLNGEFIIIVVQFTFRDGKVYYGTNNQLTLKSGLENVSDEKNRTYTIPYENSFMTPLKTRTYNTDLLTEIYNHLSSQAILLQKQQERIHQYTDAANAKAAAEAKAATAAPAADDKISYGPLGKPNVLPTEYGDDSDNVEPTLPKRMHTPVATAAHPGNSGSIMDSDDRKVSELHSMSDLTA